MKYSEREGETACPVYTQAIIKRLFAVAVQACICLAATAGAGFPMYPVIKQFLENMSYLTPMRGQGRPPYNRSISRGEPQHTQRYRERALVSWHVPDR